MNKNLMNQALNEIRKLEDEKKKIEQELNTILPRARELNKNKDDISQKIHSQWKLYNKAKYRM